MSGLMSLIPSYLIIRVITLKSFVLGSGALLLSQILFPIIAIVFAIVLVKAVSSSNKPNFPNQEPQVNTKSKRDYIDIEEDHSDLK